MLTTEGLERSRWSFFPDLFTFAAKGDTSGGADDDEGDDEEDEEDEDEDEGKDEATLRAELKASRAALATAKGTSTKAFAKRRELKGELARLNGLLAGGKTAEKDEAGEDTGPTAAQIAARLDAARLEGSSAADVRAIKSAARGYLAGAGAAEGDIGDLVRLLDIDELDLDEDGNVEGLDEQISALKVRRPGMFGTRSKRRRISGDGDDGEERKSKVDTRTPSELQAAAILGG